MARVAAKSGLTAALGDGDAGCWIGDNLYGQTTPYFKALMKKLKIFVHLLVSGVTDNMQFTEIH
jgi:hypothetical protein